MKITRVEVLEVLGSVLVNKMEQCQVVGYSAENKSDYPVVVELLKEIEYIALNHEVN